MRQAKFKTKIALIFFAFYAILSFYLISVFYVKAVIVQKEQLRKNLMRLSSLATNIVTPDLIEKVQPAYSSMETKEYSDLVEALGTVMETNPDISDAYVLVETEKPGIMKFLANADKNEIVDCGEEFDIRPYPEMMKASKGPAADHEITQDKWGWWLSAYAPILKENGEIAGILGVDVSAETIGNMQSLIKKNALYVFLVGIIFSLAAGQFASWWLTKPLNVLIKGMGQIRSGNLNYKISLGTKDELGKVGDNFNQMAEELKKYIKDLTEATSERERLNRELEIAAELQKAMLPQYDLEVKEVDLAGISLPARQVGGDYFDYMSAKDGHNIGFVIADATGKGLHSSIFMTNSRSIFKVITTEEISPSKVIKKTNDLVIKDIHPSASGMFVTMFYGIYDKDEKVFRYSNAGHNPPLFIDRGKSEVNLLNSHGCPIGILEDETYAEDEIKMKEGDSVVLYTDGVIEAMNDREEMFNLDRLTETVKKNKDLRAQEMVNKIREEVFSFCGERPQFDDFTLLVFKVK